MSMPKCYIDVLYELIPDETEQLISGLPDVLIDLISSVEMKLSQCDSVDNRRRLDIIRLALCVAGSIGGKATYMPYPRNIETMVSFVRQLTGFVLQPEPISIDAIKETIERPVIQHKSHWPTFLQATLEVLQCELSDIEMTHSQKENLARVFIESFLLNFSGRARSFPLASNRYALLKRKAAYKAFTGDNINDLVGRFGITGSVLYSYIRQERASRRAAFNAQTQNG